MAEPEVEAAWRAEFKRIGETKSRPHRGGLNASALRRQRSCSARCRDAEAPDRRGTAGKNNDRPPLLAAQVRRGAGPKIEPIFKGPKGKHFGIKPRSPHPAHPPVGALLF